MGTLFRQGALGVTRTLWSSQSYRYALQGFAEPQWAATTPTGKHLQGLAQLFPLPWTLPLGSALGSSEVWELHEGGPQRPGPSIQEALGEAKGVNG